MSVLPPRCVESVVDLIGNTPLVRLRNLPSASSAEVYAKLEALSPGGSVKDRLGIGLIRAAERDGTLAPGGTIIEPTAGNTGIGLALVGTQLGYRVILVVPEHFSVEKREIMRALGGEVVLTSKDGGIKEAIEKAHELSAGIPGSIVPQQFANPANPQIHYETTGPEIWEQMDHRVDAWVAGAGTGGTFSGVARFLKEMSPGVHATIVETEGSVLQGGPAGPHEVEGIGTSFLPPALDMALIDEFIMVPDVPAFQMVAELAKNEGILGGSSSGANVFAALEVARRLGPGKRVVTIIPDTAERYISKGIFSKWRS